MNIGDKKTAVCYDGETRTGTVVYIHPRRYYYLLELEGSGGEKWRESILFDRSEPVEEKYRRKGKPYMPEEDKMILSSKNIYKLARELGRDPGSLFSRRTKLKREGAA